MVSCIVNSTVTFWVNHRWISTIVQKMLQAAVIKRRHKMQRVLRIAAFNSGAFQHKCFPTNKLSQFTECDALITLVTVRCRRGRKKKQNKTKKHTHKYDSFASSSSFWWFPEKWRSTLKRTRNKYFNIHFLEVNWTRMRFFFFCCFWCFRENKERKRKREVFSNLLKAWEAAE